MGKKGAKLTGDATARMERLVDPLGSLGEVTSKKMFGGYGVFCEGVMFALVDSAGVAHLRADESTVERFQRAGSTKHSRMPYWSIPAPVLNDQEKLVEWATDALAVAGAAKK